MSEPKKIKIDSLPVADPITNSDVLPIVQGSSGSREAKKLSLTTYGTSINTSQEYSGLQTTNKTVVGAINEVKELAGASALVDLTDVDVSEPTSGQVLKYDGNNWVNADDEGGGALADLTDVNVTSKVNGDSLVYNSTDEEWKAKAVTKELTQAQYDALVQSGTVDPDTAYFITDTNGDGQAFQPVIYSETEREIGVWTDGKPLYEKSVPITSAITIGTSWTSTGITLSDADKIVSSELLRNAVKGNTAISAQLGSTGVISLATVVNNTNVDAGSVLTLRYTKSTDTAGSGTWTPQGVPAVHYSTDEHVVGTWIDGSTLYEKTYSVSSSVSIGTSWSDTGFELPTNTNRIIEGFMYRNAHSGPLMYCAFSIGSSNHLNALLSVSDTLDAGSSITIRYTKSS